MIWHFDMIFFNSSNIYMIKPDVFKNHYINALILNASRQFFLVMVLLGQNVIADQLQIGRYYDKHVENCEEYPEQFFEHKKQLTKFESFIKPDSKMHQECEKKRADYKEKNSDSNFVLTEFSSRFLNDIKNSK